MKLQGRLLKVFQVTPSCKRLLDVGCGPGYATVRFLEKADEVYGIDYDPALIKEAKGHNKKIHWTVGKGEKLPYKTGFFDVVIMSDVLEHVENERRSLDEVHRVLRKGGTLVISVPHKGLFRMLDSFNMKFYFPTLYRWFKGKAYNPDIYTIAPWHRHYSREDIATLTDGKFTIGKVFRGGLLVYPVATILRDSVLWKMHRMKLPVKTLRAVNNQLSHWDYMINYGRIGWHIVLTLKKR